MPSTSNSFSQWEYRTIALAGITQGALLAQTLANHGSMSDAAARASINTLLVLNPASVADVYPNVSHLSMGLQSLQNILDRARVKQNPDLVKYTLGLLILRGKFMANPTMQHDLREALVSIEAVEPSVFDTQLTEPTSASEALDKTIEQLARLYQDTISTLPFRIQVQGKMEHLKNDRTASRIRAMLLAGIRSAVLWHQLGGRRWHLLVHRKRIHDTAAAIRRKLIVSV